MKKSGVLLLLGLLSLFQTQAQETNITAETKADTVRMTVDVRMEGIWSLDIRAKPGTMLLTDWGDDSPIEHTDDYIGRSHYYMIPGIYNITIWTESVGQLTGIHILDGAGAYLLTSLDVSGCKALSDLGIRGISSLTTLNVSGCTSLERLPELYEASSLTNLDISGCTSLRNFLFLPEFVSLKMLRCANNGWTQLDVPIGAALKVLDCHGNQLTSLNVSGCTALDSLDCSYNPLTSLDVSSCNNLRSLNASGTALSMLDFSKNPLLTSLNVSGCKALYGLEFSNHPSLTTLNVSGCITLQILLCDNNPLERIDASGCTELKSLSCEQNRLESLNVSGCIKLATLHCKDNQLIDLNLSGCKSMGLLICNNNRLTSLDVSGMSLWSLECNNNRLTNLNVRGCTAMETLYCNDNRLTSLDVRSCIAMKSLRCNNNQLTSLDVSSMALQGLYCNNNRLTNLNMSGCTAMESLDCKNNLLTSLDVRQNADLYALVCSGNRLKSLDLSGNEQCQYVRCDNNHISLSSLYPLMARRTTETLYQFSPQSDTVSLEGGAVFDLSKEMQFESTATTWSVHNLDGSAVATGTFEENNGQFRFLKKGDYRLVLQNDSVRQQYFNMEIGTDDSSAVVFTWVVKVLSTPPPLQDTILMKVVGTSAEFSFTADKNAMYCVDWGDGSEERQACTAGEEKTLTHTYTDSNTYDITFFVYEKPEPTDYTEPFAGIDMVWVKGDTFTMGATLEQGSDYSSDERPTDSVTLTGYYIGKYEITQAQWKAVMGTTIDEQAAKVYVGASLAGVGDNYPMYYVSWDEAKTFCEKLSQKTGKNYALPTEAQWEFAARGGVKSEGNKYSGSNNIDEVAWYYSNSSSKTHAVGTKAPNELGIYDMSGNVWEWCADWYGEYSSDAVTDPTGPTTGSNRVDRGGCWRNGATLCRVSDRGDDYPDNRYADLGFRVVCLP